MRYTKPKNFVLPENPIVEDYRDLFEDEPETENVYPYDMMGDLEMNYWED